MGGDPLLKLGVRGRAGLGRLNQKVGVEMNPVSTTGVADGGRPGFDFFIIQLQVFLQGFEGCEGRRFWRPAGFPFGSGPERRLAAGFSQSDQSRLQIGAPPCRWSDMAARF